MKTIIGFAGRKRCGKGAITTYLSKEYGATIVTVASPLKDLCCEMLNCSLEQLNYDKDNGTNQFSINVEHASVVLNKYFNMISTEDCRTMMIEGNISSVRDLLQFVGTDIIRKHNPNWHVEQLIKNINAVEDGLVVIDDVRFPNERKAVEDLGGTVFYIIRPDLSIPISNHSSETSLHWYDFDDNRVIVNQASLSFLLYHFEHCYLSNFQNNEIPILKSGLHCYDNERATFGLPTDEFTDIDALKERLHTDNLLRQHGIINQFCTSVNQVNKYYTALYKTKPKTPLVPTSFTVRNPYIIENLKALL